MFKTKERIYVTADRSRVVDEDDPEAAMLLAAEGQEIPDAEAERLGLTGRKRSAEPVVVHSIAADPTEEAPADEDDEPEVKAVERAPANKARSRASEDT